jgi:hypothetical protein
MSKPAGTPAPDPSLDRSAAAFYALIDRVIDAPEAEAELHARFSQTVATLVVDYTDMVRRTDAHGIAYALGMARKATAVLAPPLEARGAVTVKIVADTVFCIFEDPRLALEGALAARRALLAFNAERTGCLGHADRNDAIHPCMGLGFGPTLVVPRHDLFGAETSRAFVLGEDVAGANEVLCTRDFLAAVSPLPEGVGAFAAPGDRVEEAGFPFHVVRDYRD